MVVKLRIPNTDYLYACHAIVIPSHIEPKTVEPITKQILALHMSGSKKPLSVFVTSAGGEVPAAFQIVELLISIKMPVTTYCLGEACSAGLDIFLAGDIRIATPRSCFLLHQFSWGKDNDKYHELEARRGIEDWYQKMSYDYIKERAGEKAAEKYLSKSDVWLTPRQAQKLGIVHRVVKRINIPRYIGSVISKHD